MQIEPAGDGVTAVAITRRRAPSATWARFAAPPGERFYGFGERSDAVERRGLETENYVADGPVRPEDRQYVKASVPPWADRERDDATYYPVPWLLSSRGYGVLIDEDATSRFLTDGPGVGGGGRRRPPAPARLRGADARRGRCAASRPPSGASRRPRRPGPSAPGSRPASPTSCRSRRSGR